ncbi:MAG: hypothetical protein ACRBBN_18575 [Methyloligellaceae bacterium]
MKTVRTSYFIKAKTILTAIGIFMISAWLPASAVEGIWFDGANFRSDGQFKVGRVLDFSNGTFHLGGGRFGNGDKYSLMSNERNGTIFLSLNSGKKIPISSLTKNTIQVQGNEYYRAILITQKNAKEFLPGSWGYGGSSCDAELFTFNANVSKVRYTEKSDGKVKTTEFNFRCQNNVCIETDHKTRNKMRLYYIPKLDLHVSEILEAVTKNRHKHQEDLNSYSTWSFRCQ